MLKNKSEMLKVEVNDITYTITLEEETKTYVLKKIDRKNNEEKIIENLDLYFLLDILVNSVYLILEKRDENTDFINQ